MDATVSSILPELSTFSLHAPRSAQMEEIRNPEAAESDQKLMERFRGGDAAAFNELYRRFCSPLRRFVAKLSGGQDEANEIVQEVWLAVIRGARTYRPAAKFSTYLFSIAHRRLQDHWRSRERRGHAAPTADSTPDVDEIADGEAALPEDWAARAELRKALMAAIDQLPPPQRAVFLLKAEADLSLEEIAAATDASVEATKSRMRYAVARLRTQLATWGCQETRST
ncbi:MAG: sigma-70 family RNA polymerase sigma factor [Steroidobacteraceae bacterium]